MSLRPRDPNLTRVARAGQRMAPGGRRWSESPIPRVGPRRVRSQSPAPVTVDTFTYFTGGGQLNYGQTNYPDNTLDNMGGTAGETYVALLTCVGVAPLLPSGWTTLISGNAGSLYYRAGYIQWGPSTPQEQISTITGDTGSLDPPTNTGRMVWNMWGITGHYTPSAAVDTRSAATSHPFKLPSGLWGSPWNHNAYLVPHPIGSSSASPTYDSGFTPYLVDYGEGAGYPHLADDMSANGGYGGSEAMSVIDSTRISVNNWDSASFAFGWTR